MNDYKIFPIMFYQLEDWCCSQPYGLTISGFLSQEVHKHLLTTILYDEFRLRKHDHRELASSCHSTVETHWMSLGQLFSAEPTSHNCCGDKNRGTLGHCMSLSVFRGKVGCNWGYEWGLINQTQLNNVIYHTTPALKRRNPHFSEVFARSEDVSLMH